MEFNKYDYFYSSKNTKESLYRTKFANICEFEHEKRIIILTLKKRRMHEDNEELKKNKI